MIGALLTASVLGIVLLIHLASGRFPYATWKVLIAWAFAFIPLMVIIWPTLFGFQENSKEVLLIAVFLNMNAFALAWASLIRFGIQRDKDPRQ